MENKKIRESLALFLPENLTRKIRKFCQSTFFPLKLSKKLTTAAQKLTTAGQISQNWKIKISREFGLVFF